MISSVPYVPPDTMKNVAATSGQSVNLAMDFLAVGNARDGYWVGEIKNSICTLVLLNDPRSRAAVKRVRSRRIQESFLHAREKCVRTKLFLSFAPLPLVRFAPPRSGAVHFPSPSPNCSSVCPC